MVTISNNHLVLILSDHNWLLRPGLDCKLEIMRIYKYKISIRYLEDKCQKGTKKFSVSQCYLLTADTVAWWSTTVHVDSASKHLLFGTNTKDRKLTLATPDTAINEIWVVHAEIWVVQVLDSFYLFSSAITITRIYLKWGKSILEISCWSMYILYV